MTTATAARPVNPASPKQLGFILKLIDERQVPDAIVIQFTEVMDRPDFASRQASTIIDELLKLPKAVRVAVTIPPRVSGLEAAVPALPLHFAVRGDKLDVDRELVFGRVAKYNGHVYLRELFGAPGGFRKERFNRHVEAGIVSLLMADWKQYSDLFAAHYSVCGKCAAELTDEVSRATGYGPTCRRLLGL